MTVVTACAECVSTASAGGPRAHADWQEEKRLGNRGRDDRFSVSQPVSFLKQRKSTQNGAGRLFDRTMVTCSCGTGPPRDARYDPIGAAGGRACGLKHSGHCRVGEEIPLASVLLTRFRAMELQTDSFADSTGVQCQLV